MPLAEAGPDALPNPGQPPAAAYSIICLGAVATADAIEDLGAKGGPTPYFAPQTTPAGAVDG